MWHVNNLINKDELLSLLTCDWLRQVDLGWYSHGEQLEHWYEIMEHPHRAADYWHPIIKTGKIAS